MAELIVRSELTDALFWYNGGPAEPYATCHDALSATNVYQSGSYLTLGQTRGGDPVEYQIHRLGLPFDATALPSNATPTAAILSLRMRDASSNWSRDFDVVIVDGSSLADTPELADYGRLLSSITSFGSKNTSLMPEVGNAWHHLELTPAGVAIISKTAITKFGLRSSRDIDSDPPPSLNWIGFYSRNSGFSYAPKLTITYLILPIVATNPATEISTRGAILNGTLTDDVGEACDCGFEWGKTGAYGNITATILKTTGGTFPKAIAGLEPSMTYHFRAFAINSAGTGYGIDRSFTTSGIVARLGAKDIVTLEAARNIEMMGLGRFYIDEQGNATYESRFHRSR